MSERVARNGVVSRRDFIVFATAVTAALESACKGLKPKEYPTFWDGELTEFLRENSKPLLSNYLSVDWDLYQQGEVYIDGPAVTVGIPGAHGIFTPFSAYLFKQERSVIAVLPKAASFSFVDEDKKLLARPNTFAAAIVDNGLLKPIAIDSVELEAASVRQGDLLNNIRPGLTVKQIEEYWPGTLFEYQKGWLINRNTYPGYDLAEGATWQSEKGGEVYTIQLREAGRKFLRDQSS